MNRRQLDQKIYEEGDEKENWMLKFMKLIAFGSVLIDSAYQFQIDHAGG
jgi:hypothetical protein